MVNKVEIVVIDAKGWMSSQAVMRAKTFGLSSHRPDSIGYQDPRKSSKNIESFALHFSWFYALDAFAKAEINCRAKAT